MYAVVLYAAIWKNLKYYQLTHKLQVGIFIS